MVEIVGNHKYPLKTLITPYATKRSTDRLRYDVRLKSNVPYEPALPERVVANLVGQIRLLAQPSNYQTNIVEDALFKYFCSKCGEGQAVKVAASIIAHNTGGYYKLDDIGTSFDLPFTMDEPVQRRLLRAAAQFEHDQLDEGIKRQEKENATWNGLPKLRVEQQQLKDFLSKIDEREGAPVTPGQLA